MLERHTNPLHLAFNGVSALVLEAGGDEDLAIESFGTVRSRSLCGWTTFWRDTSFTVSCTHRPAAESMLRSREPKGWRRRFNSVPGHHHSKELSGIASCLPSPLSVRYFSTRSGSVPGYDVAKDLNSNCPSLSPLSVRFCSRTRFGPLAIMITKNLTRIARFSVRS